MRWGQLVLRYRDLFFAERTWVLPQNPSLDAFSVENVLDVTRQLTDNRWVLKLLLTNCTLLLVSCLFSHFLPIQSIIFSFVIVSGADVIDWVPPWLLHLVCFVKRRDISCKECIITSWLYFVLELKEPKPIFLLGFIYGWFGLSILSTSISTFS